jgi:hypothetical protein
MLKPAGRILVTDSSGKRISSRALTLDTFLPRTAIDYPVLLPRKFLQAGHYRARVILRYSNRASDYAQSGGSVKSVAQTLTVRRTLGFTVTDESAKQVYSGPKPYEPVLPAASTTAATGGLMSTAAWAAACFAAVLGLVCLSLLRGRRRRRDEPDPPRRPRQRRDEPDPPQRARQRRARRSGVSEDLVRWRESLASDSSDQ